MKHILIITLAALAATAFADAAQMQQTDDAKAAARAERRRNRGTYEQRAYGGIVTKPNSAKGKVVILNAQKLVPAADIQPALDYIKGSLHPEMSMVDVDSVKLSNPKADIARTGGNVGVVLADAPDLPMLVVAPESGWAVVNVAALKDGKKDGLARRVRVELLRAFGLAAGCAFMSMDPVVLYPNVLIPEDLDALKDESYGVFARTHIEKWLPLHGVTPWRVTTYDVACKEGWAHSPTNKFEQRIWNKIFAIPDKPLKIEYDPKKDK